VTGDVEVAVDGESGRLRGYDDLVVVTLPSVTAGRRLAEALSTTADTVGERLPRAFERADVTVDVRVRGASVVRLGPEADTGILDRRLSELLGVPASLSLGGVVRSLFR
jgi:hypothetical protein